jgi:hypothetical protein
MTIEKLKPKPIQRRVEVEVELQQSKALNQGHTKAKVGLD